MSSLLMFVPLATTLILGVVFVLAGEARLAIKLAGAAAFVVAVYLQFFTRHALAGLFVQIALAVALAAWRKANAS